jgi:transcriptional regulator with GAF, ATPase, and Fis domain
VSTNFEATRNILFDALFWKIIIFMKHSLTVKTSKKDTLSAKITTLKRSVFVLLKEIKRLEMTPFADISRGIDLSDELRRFEIRLIQRALEETGGHQAHAARLLGINVTTLHSKIKRYGIKPHNLIINIDLEEPTSPA